MATLLRTERFSTAPTLADLEALAEEAIQALPPVLKRFTGDLVLHVDDFPDDDTLEELECETPFDLMGLYRGVDLARKSVGSQAQDVDHIFLYRRPLLDYWCETGEDLSRLIRHVVIHEIGHHLGFSDEDMDRIERDG